MSNIPATFLAMMLQSNDLIGRLIGSGEGIPVVYTNYSGITGMFAQFFLVLIHYTGGFLNSYGLAIIVTAILVRVLLLPLTRTQIRGMRSMQQLQPVMKEIQRYYPNKQDQSAKTMELYQRYKVNPFAGCLPMLIQLPILFGVYRALYDPFFGGKTFFGIQLLFPVNVTSGRSFGLGPSLTDIVDITIAEHHLAGHLWQLPEGIPLLGGSFFYLPALALVVLYIASSLVMQRTIRKVNAPDPAFKEEFASVMKHKSTDGNGKPQQPDMGEQMQKQMKIMNLLIIFFAFIFSSGALLYFIVQNALMTTEYLIIPKTAGGPQLDAKELRNFIRQPPPPPGQKKAGQPVKQSKGDGVAQAKAEKSNTASQEDTASGLVAADATGSTLRRPRKKRRKR